MANRKFVWTEAQLRVLYGFMSGLKAPITAEKALEFLRGNDAFAGVGGNLDAGRLKAKVAQIRADRKRREQPEFPWLTFAPSPRDRRVSLVEKVFG